MESHANAGGPTLVNNRRNGLGEGGVLVLFRDTQADGKIMGTNQQGVNIWDRQNVVQPFNGRRALHID